MADEHSERTGRPGLLGSLGRLFSSVIGLVETRLELLSNDIAFERFQLTRIVIVAAAVIVCLQAGILMAVIFLVLVVPDSARTMAVGIAALVLLGGALVGVLSLRHWLKTRPPFLAATLGELKKDRDRLRGRP